MQSRHFALLAMLLTVLAGLAPASSLAAPPTIYNLGTLDGMPNSIGMSVNNRGQVAGWSLKGDPFNGTYRSFLYTGTPGIDGVMHDLGNLGGGSSLAAAVNDSGQVAGMSYGPTGNVGQHAYLYTGTPGVDGAMADLAGGNSGGSGVNASGQVVGYSAHGSNHAFLYTGTPGINGVIHDLGTLGGIESEASAVNASGQVVGGSQLSDFSHWHAFLYAGTPGVDGIMHDLGTLDSGAESHAYAINDKGQVTGVSHAENNNVQYAFLYTGTPGVDGVMHSLGSLGGAVSQGLAINSAGQVAGISARADGALRYFLYTGTPGVDGKMIDLDLWLDAINPVEGAKWTLRHHSNLGNRGMGLSDSGLLTGTGYYDDGPGGLSDGDRAFLLDISSLVNVPEPSSLALLALAVLGLQRRQQLPRT
jgi:probable HAF family extracellular repeat protein